MIEISSVEAGAFIVALGLLALALGLLPKRDVKDAPISGDDDKDVRVTG
jgi:hypothetical protein